MEENANIVEKNKRRADRRARTNAAIDRQVAINKQHSGSELPRGFFKKHRAMDCGNPRCGLCGNVRKRHSGKAGLTIQELKAYEEDRQLRRHPEQANESFFEAAA